MIKFAFRTKRYPSTIYRDIFLIIFIRAGHQRAVLSQRLILSGCRDINVIWQLPAFFKSISTRVVSAWLIWTRNQHGFRAFSGIYRMKKRYSESVSEWYKVRGEGKGERKLSSFSSNDFWGHVSVYLWSSDLEGNWKEYSLGKLWSIVFIKIGGAKVWIGLLNHFSLYNLICCAFF